MASHIRTGVSIVEIRHLSATDNEPVEMQFTQFSRLRKLDHSYSAQEDETLVLEIKGDEIKLS